MNSLKLHPELLAPTGPDSVTSDSASLASHMSDCASARGRFFDLQTTLHSARDLLFSHIVTVVVLVVAAAGIFSFI